MDHTSNDDIENSSGSSSRDLSDGRMHRMRQLRLLKKGFTKIKENVSVCLISLVSKDVGKNSTEFRLDFSLRFHFYNSFDEISVCFLLILGNQLVLNSFFIHIHSVQSRVFLLLLQCNVLALKCLR